MMLVYKYVEANRIHLFELRRCGEVPFIHSEEEGGGTSRAVLFYMACRDVDEWRAESGTCCYFLHAVIFGGIPRFVTKIPHLDS